jgi:hypothetical protein
LTMQDAQNINAANNVGLVDGAAIGTYKNTSPGTGSLGTDTDLAAGAHPFTFRKVATPGFINGLSATESDGTQFQVSGSGGTNPQPIMVAVAIRPADFVGTRVWFNGNSSTEMLIFTLDGSGEIHIYAGSAVATGLVMTVNQWHSVVVKFDGASSSIELDGVAGTGGNTGTADFDKLELNAETSSHGANGMNALTMVWGGTLPTLAQARNYIYSRLGAMPQG